MSAVGRITESQNALTTAIDVASADSMVRLLRASDAQLFGGFGGHASLYDVALHTEQLAALVGAGLSRALAGEANGALHVVLSGSGTSGRFAFATARAMNRTFSACLAAAGTAAQKHFHYTNSGGDAGLLREAEGAEDSPLMALADLRAVEERVGPNARLLLIGISCGFSAGYVGAQLEHAMEYPERFAGVVALGFNPRECVARVQLPGWGSTYRDVLDDLAASGHAAQLRLVLDPVVGPESIAGSTRMKGGSATKMLLDACLNLGLVRAVECRQRATATQPAAALPSVACLLTEFELAARSAYAPSTVAELARLSELAAAALRRGGRLVYLGEAPAALLGIVDASECPPTFGAALSDVCAFVHGGWAAMENVEGDVSLLPRATSEPHSLQLCMRWFVRELVPQLSDADVVVLLQIGGGRAGAGVEEVQTAVAAAAGRGARVARIRVVAAGDGDVAGAPADGSANVCVRVPSLHTPSLQVWLRRMSAGVAEGGQGCSIAAAALRELSPSNAELALKLAVNAVSTCAHVLVGTVFSNCMINLTISNIKLFHRAVSLVARLGGVTLELAQRFLVRAIYGDEEGRVVSMGAVAQHVTRASVVEQVLPVAILLALRSCSGAAGGDMTVAEARTLIVEQPVLRAILQSD